MGLEVREAHVDEWQQYKSLRLAMLSDSPRAFGHALDEARAQPDKWWQIRTSSQLMPDSGWFVVADTDEWFGQMLTRDFGARAYLLEVYLSPTLRGSGWANRLLTKAEQWASAQGHRRLWLDVNEQQVAARRFYEREGFVATGERQPHELFPEDYELEMVKELRSS
ncbi:N-acetyltransferase [uncultured Tessaracoccus sp.]|uniref:GNAT family N-acetyltransferase n=1 Tax=uncultured Tessaracoccus sp. TaxID=905023 RepID=UPI002635AE42|nr:GNAT family N-acetyltransferase [uncultured Tessaracoccus sp.]